MAVNDPLGQVYQGGVGQGGAQVLPSGSSQKPIDIYRQNLLRRQRQKERDELLQQRKREKALETLQSKIGDITPDGAFDPHIPGLSKKVNQLEETAAEIYRRGGDPYNPMSPYYEPFRKMEREAKDSVLRSKNLNTAWLGAREEYMKNPDLYDEETLENLEKVTQMPIEESFDMTMEDFLVRKGFDYSEHLDSYIENDLPEIKPRKTPSDPVSKGGIIQMDITTDYTPDQQALIGNDLRMKSDDSVAYYDEEYKNLTSSEQERFEQEAAEVNAAGFAEEYGFAAEPEDMFARTKLAAKLNQKQTERKLREDPAFVKPKAGKEPEETTELDARNKTVFNIMMSRVAANKDAANEAVRALVGGKYAGSVITNAQFGEGDGGKRILLITTTDKENPEHKLDLSDQGVANDIWNALNTVPGNKNLDRGKMDWKKYGKQGFNFGNEVEETEDGVIDFGNE